MQPRTNVLTFREIPAPIEIKLALPRPPFQKFRESETTIKIKFALFRGGLGRGAGRKIVQNAIFHGKRHDNKILKVKILLSRNFVVIAQAPKNPPPP